ncbi:hypothetical protein Q7P37_004542 [Cladosporium fusiforme]
MSDCPIPDGVQDLHLTGSSYNTLRILSIVCTGITLCSTLVLITLHLLRYSAPKEQRQIIRLIFAPFVFAIVSLAQIFDYSIARYLDPIGSFYEAICLCSLFLLYVQYAVPSGTFGEALFEAMKAKQEKEDSKHNWPRATWIAVFQYPIVDLVAIIILEATEAAGTYCESSLRPKYGHFWYSLISSVGIAIAVLSIVRFYARMKSLMKARRGLAKIVCFKAIVGVRFLQSWIFNILIDKNVIHTSSTFTYGDLLYGIPNVLTCIESIFFAASFWYAFSSTEYSSSSGRRLPLWRAVLDALNPSDLIFGILRMFASLGSGAGSESSQGIAPMTRSGRGRYRTLDGMESLSRPERSRSRTPFQEAEWRSDASGSMGRQDSPPRYDAPSSYLSPGGRSNVRTERQYGFVEERDMV